MCKACGSLDFAIEHSCQAFENFRCYSGEAYDEATWVEHMQALQKELERVEKEIPTAGIPSVILDDFRRALDHLRNTVWAVTTVREKNAEQVSLAIVNSRIHRTTEMCERIIGDIDASRIAMDSPNVVKLYTVMNLMHGTVRQLF